MTLLAPGSNCENAAQTAHRTSLYLGSQSDQFLTASLGQDAEDNRPPIHSGALEAAESQKIDHLSGCPRPLHRGDATGNNTFRKGASTHAPSG